VGPIIERNKAIAKRKGTLAAVAAGGTVLAFVAVGPVLGLIGAAGAAYLGYDWFNFRKQNGVRL
jgi:hypothetical protein